MSCSTTEPESNHLKIPSAIAISVGKWCIFAEIGWTHLETVWSRYVPIYHGAEVGNVCGVLLIALNVFVSSNDHPVWAACLAYLATMCLSQESISHPLAGWWFQTFYVFHNIWDNPSHWLICFKMVKTSWLQFPLQNQGCWGPKNLRFWRASLKPNRATESRTMGWQPPKNHQFWSFLDPILVGPWFCRLVN